jgi:hypothetical protein
VALDEQRASRNADDDNRNEENQAKPQMHSPQGAQDRAIRSQLPIVFAQAPSRFATPNSDAGSMHVELDAPAQSRRASPPLYTLARETAKADMASRTAELHPEAAEESGDTQRQCPVWMAPALQGLIWWFGVVVGCSLVSGLC